MTPHALLRLLAIWLAVLSACSLLIFCIVRLDRARPATGPYLVSVWEGGVRSAREVVSNEQELAHALEGEAARRGAQRIVEQIVDSAPIFWHSWLLLGMSVVPARDGLSASYQGRTAYASPDDLRKLEAYEFTAALGPVSLVLGVDVNKALGALAHELGTEPAELLRHGSFRRFAVVSDAAYPRNFSEADVTVTAVRNSVQSAARYLLRNQRKDGSFRYELNAVTGGESEEYNYPRHAGAAYFLARAGNQFHDPQLLRAGQRAGAFMKDRATLHCGAHACVGEGGQVDIGSSALALLAYVELLGGGIEEFRAPALELAGFLRSQQRADGEFQHFYSVAEQHSIDAQTEYYTGEAAFALARVHRVSGDPKDLEAARHALSFLVKRSAWFLGSHYFWAAEHWTCQALADLWQRAPDPVALKFCLDWQAVNRNLQFDSPPAPSNYDGGISRGPFMAPRLTPTASRLEAAVATLEVARAAGVPTAQLELIEHQIKRSFAFLLRYQFSPGPTHLMPNARPLNGGFPGSPIDLHVRIDYPQHAGGALLRYWELEH
ncbi:MAG: prenyltransferase/squalene oxidase repeat-containing protein [Pseudomonadota bacterium]